MNNSCEGVNASMALQRTRDSFASGSIRSSGKYWGKRMGLLWCSNGRLLLLAVHLLVLKKCRQWGLVLSPHGAKFNYLSVTS